MRPRDGVALPALTGATPWSSAGFTMELCASVRLSRNAAVNPSSVQRFAMPWDGTTRVITSALVVAAIGIEAALAYGLWTSNPRLPAGYAWLAGAAFLLPVVGSFLLRPCAYRVDRGELLVERLIHPVRIGLDQIASAESISPQELRGAIRLLGSGGAFGYYGHFWNRSLGRFRLYAGNRRELVLLRLKDGRRFVLSPARAEAFIAALRDGAL